MNYMNFNLNLTKYFVLKVIIIMMEQFSVTINVIAFNFDYLLIFPLELFDFLIIYLPLYLNFKIN